MSEDLSILVLEDDPELQGILVDVLDDRKYSAYGVSSAAEAIAAVQESEERGEPFDIVLSDVRMAGGMDGLSALAVIKERKPEMRCIVMTGYTLSKMDDPATQEAPVRACAIEVDDFLSKPFEMDQLIGAIDRLRQRGKGTIANWLANYQAGNDEKARLAVRKSRYSVWNLFRLAVRSHYFTVGQIDPALRFWDALERVETLYFQGVHQAKGSPDNLKALAQHYENFREAAQKRMKARSSFGSGPRDEKMVQPADLKQLLLNVQKDRVSVEDLHLAVYCRRVTPDRLRANPFLVEVYQRLWLPEKAQTS
jgi:CheY-like chemotaxis protein